VNRTETLGPLARWVRSRVSNAENPI